MSSRMRVTKGHTGNRRSHHALVAPRLSKCSNCGDYHQRHRICKECGFYKGIKITSFESKEKTVTVPEENSSQKTS